MSKAEEAALQRYAFREVTAENVKLHDEFQAGYEQAEKDLGWIFVKERLPGPSEWVVACVEVDGICTRLTLATYNEETKEWHTDNWIDGEQEVYYPDYWMPIPNKI